MKSLIHASPIAAASCLRVRLVCRAERLACNCTVCRRYGVLWIYGCEGEEINVSGDTRAYARGEKVLNFHFCPDCGCVAWWRSNRPGKDGRRRIP